MKKLIYIIMLLFTGFGFAQESKSYHFYNQTTAVLKVDALNSSFGFTTINGIQFRNRIGVGLGIGIEKQDYKSFSPLFLEGRFRFFKDERSPFISLNAGALMKARNEFTVFNYNPGYRFGASVGMNLFFTEHLGVTASFGYVFSRTRGQTYYCCWCGNGNNLPLYPYFENSKLLLHAFELKLGIAIK
jgi:hypothetical protein